MKKFILLVLALVVCLSFVGCEKSQENQLNNKIVALEAEAAELESEISELETQRDAIKEEITDAKVDSGDAKYVITFNIKQSHFSLDLTEHLKDSLNDISIMIPVDKEYYDSVEVGDTIDDSFRMGSLLFKGSFGKWKITVENKEIM